MLSWLPAVIAPRRRRLALLLYGLLCGLVLLTLWYLQPAPTGQVHRVSITSNGSHLHIDGQQLSADCRAVLVERHDNPQAVLFNRFLWRNLYDVATRDQHAFVLCNNVGLVTLDLRQPRQPRIVGVAHSERRLWHIELSDNNAYIACGKDGLVICDITDPSQPLIRQQHSLPYPVSDVTISGEQLLLAAGKEGIKAFDLSGRQLLAEQALEGYVNALTQQDGWLYVVSARVGNQGLLHVIDARHAGQLRLAASVAFEGVPWDVLVHGDRLYIAAGGGGLLSFALARPDSPQLMGNADHSLRAIALHHQGDQLLASSSSAQLVVYRQTRDPARPLVEEKRFHCGRINRGIAVHDGLALVAASQQGLSLIDLAADPGQPAPLELALHADHQTASWSVSPAFISIQNKTELVLLKRQPDGLLRPFWQQDFSRRIYDHQIKDNLLAINLRQQGTRLLQLRSNQPPLLLAQLPATEEQGQNINRLYLEPTSLSLCGPSGLHHFSLEQLPAAPVKTWQLPGTTEALARNGDFLFVARGRAGIEIYQLGPGSPQRLAQLTFPDHFFDSASALDLLWHDDVLYVACGIRGLLSIDVHNPRQPRLLDSLELGSFCDRLSLAQGQLLCHSNGGFFMIDIHRPEQLSRLCHFKGLRDLAFVDNALLQLTAEGIRRTTAPLLLTPRQTRRRQLSFELPQPTALPNRPAQPRFFDLYLSHLGVPGNQVAELTFTSSGRWQLGQKPPISCDPTTLPDGERF